MTSPSSLPTHLISRRLRALSAGFLALTFATGTTALQAQNNYPFPFTITTLAGTSGQTGTTDGTGTAALFNTPEGVAVDSSGNVYVSDSLNFTIRKIAPSGVVTTFAGTVGFAGSTDANGTAARFNHPIGLAVDSSDNLYVADAGNNTIRMITPQGDVTTIAGQAGSHGSTDGAAASALFNFPSGVAVDSLGNIYVSDYANSTIREISSGTVTTLAGTALSQGSTDGAGNVALFSGPSGLAVDSNRNVFVADFFNNTIRRIDGSSGQVTTYAGTSGQPGSLDDNGTAALFNGPIDVAVDASGNLYVTDASSLIRSINSLGDVTTLAGRYGVSGTSNGVGSTAQFNGVGDLTIDSSGHLYICDTASNTIRLGRQYPASDFAVLPFVNDTLVGSLTLGTNFLATAFQGLGTVASGWQERAVGDVNGDGIPDLIFQQGTLLGAWLLDASGNPVTWVNIGGMGSGWELHGAGFITQDGNLDLVFQNGTLLGFLEIGTDASPLSWSGIGEMNTGWQLHAVADLNGDGQPELVFQNATLLGALEVGTNGLPTAWHGIGEMNTGWVLSYIADVNADGQPDLIFQNGTLLGSVEVGTNFLPVAWHGIGGMGSGWVLPGDY